MLSLSKYGSQRIRLSATYETKESMRIKMKSTRYGSADGVQVDEYKKGEIYELRETLAAIFLKEGWAVRADKTPRRTKDQGTAPENKTVKPKLKRKTKRGAYGS